MSENETQKLIQILFHFLQSLSHSNVTKYLRTQKKRTKWKMKHLKLQAPLATSKNRCKFSATPSTLCLFIHAMLSLHRAYSHSISTHSMPLCGEGKSYNMKKGFTTAVTSSIDIFSHLPMNITRVRNNFSAFVSVFGFVGAH
jgi:hypothetical protein